MEDIFIQHIKVNKARNLVDFDIPLSQDERKHLLITGKNGSGKTSLLLELRNFLNQIGIGSFRDYETFNSQLLHYQNQKSRSSKTSEPNKTLVLENKIKEVKILLNHFGGTAIKVNSPLLLDSYFQTGDFIVTFFEAKRNLEFNTYNGTTKTPPNTVYNIEEKASENFMQYLINLKVDQAFSRDESGWRYARITDWFKRFEKNLRTLFDSSKIWLKFTRDPYNFNIIEDGKEPYNFNQLSGGYSAIFSIVTELIMRMEKDLSESYDIQGVVLIDEIETHLHIDLQKKILPFLTSFFPKIQFIVTTHSPFVLSSVENAVICDLEKRIVTTDLSGYSYDTLVESYFDSDKYSSILKERICEYEELLEKDDLSDEEKDRLFYLKRYVNDIPKFASDEVAVKIQQLRLKELNKRAKNGLPA